MRTGSYPRNEARTPGGGLIEYRTVDGVPVEKPDRKKEGLKPYVPAIGCKPIEPTPVLD